eukprot:3389208-Pyramimonas_sp.AAC.1
MKVPELARAHVGDELDEQIRQLGRVEHAVAVVVALLEHRLQIPVALLGRKRNEERKTSRWNRRVAHLSDEKSTEASLNPVGSLTATLVHLDPATVYPDPLSVNAP